MVDTNIQKHLDEAQDHMDKSIDHLRSELSHIRAGRANPAILDGVRVEYYGSQMPLNQVASVSAPAPDMILIQPWDKAAMEPIQKGIMVANLGLNPSNDGSLIRIAVPPLTEERRQDLVKTAKHRAEDARIAIRNIRRTVKDEIKKTQQDENLSEDMRYEGEKLLQELTDEYIETVDKLLQRKEAEIMEV